jgi:hypothetical protein
MKRKIILIAVVKCVLLTTLMTKSTQHVVQKYALAIIDYYIPDVIRINISSSFHIFTVLFITIRYFA